jgi:peptidoglycan/LPS O-acetylase OafA/YrhL
MRAPARLHSLDAARGLAAVVVVIFHWQFWGTDGQRIAPPGGFTGLRAAGEAALAFCYQCGASAVGLFFTLSGFVFYWLYRDAVHERRIGGRRFFVDRFSRLYPLHVLTLAWVWAAQAAYAPMNRGVGWNSPVGDWHGALRQLLVFPLWTPTRVVGFNLPVWSLVVEALLYVLFFVVARRIGLGVVATLALVATGGLANAYSADIGYGIVSFFMGGLAYLAFERVRDVRVERVLRLVVFGSWLFALVFGTGLVNLASTPLAGLDHVYAMVVMFPATVLYLALRESRVGAFGRRLGRLGDITYSIYLLHFPLMLTLALALRAAGQHGDAVKSPLALAGFLVVVSLLSLASHFWFELPAQRWLRARFARRSAASAGTGDAATPSTFAS